MIFHIRHDYSFYKKKLSDDNKYWLEYGLEGYVASMGIFSENINNDVIDDLNHLSHLVEIHVHTMNPYTGIENVENLKFLNRLTKIKTLFLLVSELHVIHALELPPSVNVIILDGGKGLNDDDLMSLSKFKNVNEIWVKADCDCKITAEGIRSFQIAHPNVILRYRGPAFTFTGLEKY
jgi:hypothetical protein